MIDADGISMGRSHAGILGEVAPREAIDARDPPEVVIRPRLGWIGVDWRELYHARELLFFLVWRDVKIRYKQTVLGVAWAVLQPLMTMLIFTMIFGRFAGIPSDGVPYPVFVFAGLLPWMFFATGVGQGGQSLINQQHILTKIYFPRLFVPTAAVGVALVDLAASLVVYAAILARYGIAPSRGVVALPVLLLLAALATLGLAYLLSALSVTYRDFRILVPFLVQILMYVSPVIYPAGLLPARYRAALALNPMFGTIEAFRACLLGTPWEPATLAISAASAVALFAAGLFYFRKTERRFADIA